MEPIVLIVVVVAVVAAAAIAWMLRGKPKLPPPEEPEVDRAPEASGQLAAPRAPAAPAPAAPEAPAISAPEAPAISAPEAPAAPTAPATVTPVPAKVITTPPPKPLAAPTKPAADEEAALLRKGLGATRGGLVERLKSLFTRKQEIDPATLEEVEEILLTSDVGVKTTQAILERLRARLDRNELTTADRVWDALRDEARSILDVAGGGLRLAHKPAVVLFIGVNGVGKTTTIGKLASKLKESGQRVLLAAGDTYRAAAVIQLEAWGRRVGCDVVKGKDRADPSAVIFDAVKRAQTEGYDVVLCDTAGRLHTKTPLMDELGKIGRSVEKALGHAADEVLLVLDSTTGQNALQQAQLFRDTLPLSGIVLTKLDGTAKGGVILGIVDEQRTPVRYVGIGERVEDLREFAAAPFVDALFHRADDDGST